MMRPFELPPSYEWIGQVVVAPSKIIEHAFWHVLTLQRRLEEFVMEDGVSLLVNLFYFESLRSK